MNISRRQMVVVVLFIFILLLAGLFFWPSILSNVIRPIATVAWLLLRIFILSIDQKYFWGAGIFVVLIFLYRMLPQESGSISTYDFPDTNETIETIRYWRSLFTLTDVNAQDKNLLKRELVRLVVSLYASKQRTLPSFLFYEALQRGEISLPDHIHTFLFPDEPNKSKQSIKELLQSLREFPRNWIRRRNGQEIAEFYQMIEETVSFVETSLEIENVDGKFTPNEN
jgi:hypothetical protein